MTKCLRIVHVSNDLRQSEKCLRRMKHIVCVSNKKKVTRVSSLEKQYLLLKYITKYKTKDAI